MIIELNTVTGLLEIDIKELLEYGNKEEVTEVLFLTQKLLKLKGTEPKDDGVFYTPEQRENLISSYLPFGSDLEEKIYDLLLTHLEDKMREDVLKIQGLR